MSRLFLALGLVVATSPLRAAGPSFEDDIRPLLKANCFECHGEEEKPKGGLDLRLTRLIARGGDGGPSVVAGKPDESLLLEKVLSDEMPPGKKKLSAAEKDLLRRWIAAGAKADKPEPESLAAGFQITESDRNYWSFRPIARPQPPGDGHAIDAFLLAKLKEKNLTFSPEADRATLIRRAYFDLLGLPPTPAEVAAFVKDSSPKAWETLIDTLLASPQYGERWGRHWLDVAGYADSEGYAAQDTVRTNAWKYRDYVIRSFNADKPFDRFIHEQIAGDELTPKRDTSPEVLEMLTATGFLRMAPDGTGNVPAADQVIARNQVMIETIKIVSSSFLGVTVGCAQCHNHRYDPISQVDYYRLRAIFEPAFDLTAWKPPAARQISMISAKDRLKIAEIEKQAAAIDAARIKKSNEAIAALFERELAKLPEELRDKARVAAKTPVAKRTPEQKKLMTTHPTLTVNQGSLETQDRKTYNEITAAIAEAAKLRATKPSNDTIRAVSETPGKLPSTFLFHRGDPEQPREAIAPGVPSVLAEGLPFPNPKATPVGSGRRLAFARWLTDPRNPLTARVLVNRFWQEHFGRGLVRTPGDFGRLGEKPTHPELLDWLATDFIEHGWSLKRFHRQVMTSAAYRQSSRREARHDVDPDNNLFGRYPLRRLDAEAIRDSVLAISGSLNPKMFGAPVPVRENEVGQVVLGIDNRDGAGRFVKATPLPEGDEFRRSVYVQVRRRWPLAVLESFDWATVEPNCEIRNSSTVTPQSLMLLNGDFLQQQSERMAARLMKEANDTPRRVALAWALAYGVPPSQKDATTATAFVTEMAKVFPKEKDETRALAAYCHVLLSSNRFLYVD